MRYLSAVRHLLAKVQPASLYQDGDSLASKLDVLTCALIRIQAMIIMMMMMMRRIQASILREPKIVAILTKALHYDYDYYCYCYHCRHCYCCWLHYANGQALLC